MNINIIKFKPTHPPPKKNRESKRNRSKKFLMLCSMDIYSWFSFVHDLNNIILCVDHVDYCNANTLSMF